MARMSSSLPSQKVAFGGVAGAVTILLMWVIKQFTQTELPAEVASALTTVITFAVSYFTPPNANDGIVEPPPPLPTPAPDNR